ncbi:MAG: NAD(P)H-dependent oxidoreductase [Proteobacteria bacterium]|nr:NAD(P)H-dependent oxidoreductase [Pseudomonadota bacterium]
MGKIIVIYHSQQFGDTKALAGSLAEGAREAGAEVELIGTNERRVRLDEFLAADAVALGTPDYFSYLAGTMKSFFDDIYLWDQSGEPVKGKPAVLFFSHGGGGRVKEPFEYLARKFFEQLGETIESKRPTGDEAKERCRALGAKLAKKVEKKEIGI